MTALRGKVFGAATAASLCLSLLCSAPAAGAPACNDVAPNTRVCSTGPGHTAIVTSPNPAYTNPYPGWGFGTLGFPAIGIGGGGIWMGF